jgi:hypothetical protein
MPEETPEEQQTTKDESPEQRERFDQEVIRRVFEFASELVQDVPELEVLTIVPAWSVPQQELVPAIYITREGVGMSPHHILLVTDRMVRALEYQTSKFHELLFAAGETADQQAKVINERQETITEKEKIIEELGRKITTLEELAATIPQTTEEEPEA